MASPAIEALPWRGPAERRPELPLPPGRLPLRRHGVLRKQWRWVGAFSDELMVCAARVKVGPIGQTFWAILERPSGRLTEDVSLRLPTARGGVWTEAPEKTGIRDHAPERGSLVRIEGRSAAGEPIRGFLRFEGGEWAEAICPTGQDDGYVWTRKRAGMSVGIDLRIGGRRLESEGRGVEDETEGYHPHHTVWSWSAGVGSTPEGREVAWNLVEGVNDPPERSERTIWVDGSPSEPGPVSFEGLEAVRGADGSELRFSAEAERSMSDSKPFVSYELVQPFGSFSGSLPGGIELASGLGVMEHQDARW
ncbi:MAG: DUF2804 family protein [Solirubrobacterales bacterium]|nr:DUF2804 family protein [Solirubrobacterales bacterium]